MANNTASPGPDSVEGPYPTTVITAARSPAQAAGPRTQSSSPASAEAETGARQDGRGTGGETGESGHGDHQVGVRSGHGMPHGDDGNQVR